MIILDSFLVEGLLNVDVHGAVASADGGFAPLDVHCIGFFHLIRGFHLSHDLLEKVPLDPLCKSTKHRTHFTS